MLHRISKSPTYGYEILTEIDSKTDGGWRPGPGSVYPLLKRLVAQGYAKAELAKGARAGQRKYSVTPKGAQHLSETRRAFRDAGQRWGSLRSIFVDLMEPADVGPFLLETSRRQFDIARDLLESKRGDLSPDEAASLLREYTFNLERQLGWTNQMLKSYGSRPEARPRIR